MNTQACWAVVLVASCVGSATASARQDDEAPGDPMIHEYLDRQARALDAKFAEDTRSPDDWASRRDALRDEYLYMLGLSPLPEKSPLEATVTGTVDGDGFVVENLHYQSMPGLYVTANLYRPADSMEGQRLPAVLYVCGHAGKGRNGNKTAFQSHGIWLARHGYVCLVVDTLQLGEIAGIHHGTYREGRWWWISRGYTPAGVECWNGVRGIDYLQSRPDVDPGRIGVTGISGGGAATFWIAAADERAKVAVPVSGMADLESYVANHIVDGHCDCMFLHNTFQWPWTRIAGLIAPRPMLFVNSDHDTIFPMDANERVINRLERLYGMLGVGDRVDALVSVGGHAYRRDIREGAFRFLNTYLKDDPRAVEDSETDAVGESSREGEFPIALERLRVFPGDSDIPADQKNTTIDRHFVPLAKVEPPAEGTFDEWRDALLKELRRVTFRPLPERIEPAKVADGDGGDAVRLETEPGIVVPLRRLVGSGQPKRAILLVAGEPRDEARDYGFDTSDAVLYRLEPRGVGATRWTRKNPPNTVERSHVLLGQTVDAGRVRDVAAAARYLKAKHGESVPVHVAGPGAAGLIGAYAALLEPDIAGVMVLDPPASHMDDGAPVLLNVLRVLDVPQALGMLAPRPLLVRGGDASLRDAVADIYRRAGARADVAE
jgi:dienelactone hydrolase